MILSFSKDRYVSDIHKGIKLHTIREDKTNRWKVGRTIQFWRGNPRNINAKIKPYQFGTGKVMVIQRITLLPNREAILIDGKEISRSEVVKLVKRDGFDSVVQFFEWFDQPFSGKLIWFAFDQEYS